MRRLPAARADRDAMTQPVSPLMYQGATRTPWDPPRSERDLFADLGLDGMKDAYRARP